MELRELNDRCYCGEAGRYKCKPCGSKKYCSRHCQKLDWPLHKKQCSNEAVITTALETISPDQDIVEQHRELMKRPHWQRWLTCAYSGLRDRVGVFPEPGTFAVNWLGIVAPGSVTPVPVAFIYIAAEPQHLYMYVVDTKNEDTAPTLETWERKPLLVDDQCVVFDTEVSRKPNALLYPIPIVIPAVLDMTVDWDLRQC